MSEILVITEHRNNEIRDITYETLCKALDMAEKSGNIRRFRRVFIGGASACNCDKQDRILIPQALREYAILDKDIVLVGVLDHFEIWSRENWDLENTDLEKDMKKEEVRNEIAKLGI